MRNNYLFITLLFASILLLNTSLIAQYNPSNIAPYNSHTYLINNVLLGNGVTATNIKFQGQPVQLGFFNGGNSGNTKMGIDSGIVISSGDIYGLVGPASKNSSLNVQPGNANFPHDSDIIKIIQSKAPGKDANDVAILEFDFIPLGDTVKFDYFFGSEEYFEYVCSYNDGFGMIISGPGINGTYTNKGENIALIPGTTLPVSIYNINKMKNPPSTGCAWANSNTKYYVDNLDTAISKNPDFALDGYTTVFTAKSHVQCGSKYHLKFVIADAGDHILDSYVFLKARSLVSNQVSFMPTSSSGIVGDSSLVEGCNNGFLTFNRPGNLDTALVVHLSYNDTIPKPWTRATKGIDYIALPDSIIFPPKTPIIKIPIHVVKDNLNEPIEGIAITMKFKSGCGSLTQFTRYMYIVNPLPTQVTVKDVNVCPGDTVTLAALVKDGYAPFSYKWGTGNPKDTNKTYTFLPDSTKLSTNVWVTVKSKCTLTTDIDTATIRITPFNPLTISVVGGANSINENCGDSLQIKFKLDFKSKIPLGVKILHLGTAKRNLDYAMTDTLSFAAGDSVKFLWLKMLSDKIKDPNETIRITGNPKNVCSGTVNSISISVKEFDSISVTIASPSPVCPNFDADYLANATGTNKAKYTYQWSGTPIGTNSNPKATYKLTTDTTLMVTVNDTVCGKPYSKTATTKVIVSPALTVKEITSNKDSLLCPKDTAILSIVATGRNPLKYTWTGIPINNKTINAYPTSTQTFTVKVTDLCNSTGITKSKTIYVPTYQKLEAYSTKDTTANCPNDSVKLYAFYKGGGPSKRIYWNDTLSKAMNYKLISTDTLGRVVEFKVIDVCRDTAISRTTVRLRTYHSIVVTAGNDTSGCPDAKLPLYANVTREGNYNGGYLYNWTLMNSSNAITGADSLKTFTVLSSTDSIVKYVITATDYCNISKSDTVTIKRKKSCTPKGFNVLTPGSNDANNSKFAIEGIEEYPKNKVQIFNRWGKKVFEQEDYKNSAGWEADDVDAGTYYYIVTYTNPPDGRKAPEPTTGFLEIIK